MAKTLLEQYEEYKKKRQGEEQQASQPKYTIPESGSVLEKYQAYKQQRQAADQKAVSSKRINNPSHLGNVMRYSAVQNTQRKQAEAARVAKEEEPRRLKQEDAQKHVDTVTRLTEQYMPVRPDPMPQVDINKKYGPSSKTGGYIASTGVSDAPIGFGKIIDLSEKNGQSYNLQDLDNADRERMEQAERDRKDAVAYQSTRGNIAAGRGGELNIAAGRGGELNKAPVSGWDYDANKAQDLRGVEQEDEIANKYQLPSNGRGGRIVSDKVALEGALETADRERAEFAQRDMQGTKEREAVLERNLSVEDLQAKRVEAETDIIQYDKVLKYPPSPMNVEAYKNYLAAQTQKKAAQEGIDQIDNAILIKQLKDAAAYTTDPFDLAEINSKLKVAEYKRDWANMDPEERIRTWAWQRIERGFLNFNRSYYGLTTDLIADFFGIERSAVSKQNQKQLDEINKEIAYQAKSTTAIQGGLGDILSMAVENLPNIAMSLLGGGGIGVAANAAMDLKTAAAPFVTKFLASFTKMVKNPMFWNSFIRSAGGNYIEEHDVKGKDPIIALTGASIKGFLDATIEVGGGIETGEIKPLGLSSIHRTGLEEMGEELFQNPVARAYDYSQSGIGAKTKLEDIISWDNPNAIISGKNLAQEGIMGYAGGAALAGMQQGGAAVVNTLTGADMAAKPKSEYNYDALPKAPAPIITPDTASSLKTIAATLPETSEARKIADTYDPSAPGLPNTGNLFRAVLKDVGAENQQVIIDTIARSVDARLAELGEQGDTMKVAQAIATMYGSVKLSEDQRQTIIQSEHGQPLLESMLKADVAEAQAKEIADREQAAAAERVKQDKGVYERVLDEIKDMPDALKEVEGLNPEQQKAFATAYELGRFGIQPDKIKGLPGMAELGEAKALKAVGYGAEMWDKALPEMQKRAAQVQAQMPRAGKGKITFDESIDRSTWKKEQRAQMSLEGAIIQALGYQVEIYQSKPNEQGIYTAENGSYRRADGSFRIDINAGKLNDSVGNTLISLAQGHEIVHHLLNTVPDLGRDYIGYALDELVSKGQDIGKLIQAKIDRSISAGRPIDMRKAIEEVIADGSEMMLKDTKAPAMLAEKNPNLFKRIQEWLKNFTKRLREAFAGIDPAHVEAKALMEVRDGILQYSEELRKRFDTAIVEEASRRTGVKEAVKVSIDTVAQTAKKAAEKTVAEVKPAVAEENIPKSAPVKETAEAIAKGQTEGKAGTVFTAENEKISYHYAIVPAASVTASNNTDMSVNPAYPKELQPRDTDRTASADLVQKISRELEFDRVAGSPEVTSGAPVVGADMIVEVGNHRFVGIKKALEQGGEAAKRYISDLKAKAAEFGIDPGAVKPDSVLVRVRDTDMKNRKNFTQAGNVQVTNAYSDTESAETDASKLTPAMLDISDMSAGEIDTAANARFVARFVSEVVPSSERGKMVDSKGNLSTAGTARIRNALFHLAYHDGYLTEQLAEATDVESRNMVKAMTGVAARLAEINADMKRGLLHDLDIGEQIAEAYRTVLRQKLAGVDVEAYLAQTTMLDELPPAQRALLEMFAQNKRSAAKMTDALHSILDAVQSQGNPGQAGLLGEQSKPSVAGVISEGIRAHQKSVEEAASERFSLREPIEEAGNLIAIHNLSEAQLNDTIKLGGFAMPSIAVLKDGTEHSRYGDISVVFGKETIDPENYGNKVYGGDAWTPSFPQIDYEISDTVSAGIRKKVSSLLGPVYKDMRPALDDDNMQDVINRAGGDPVKAYEDNNALKAAYLRDMGENFTPRYSEPDYGSEFGNDAVKYIAERMGDKIKEALGGDRTEFMSIEPDIRKTLNGMMDVKFGGDVYAQPLGFGQVDRLARAVAQYMNSKGVMRFDATETGRDIREAMKEGNRETEYKAWVKDLFNGIVEKSGIRNNAEYFTPSGNRRSFSATHWAVTLDNVVRAMRMQEGKGSDSWGSSGLFGVSTKNYSSLSDIRKDISRLQQMDEEQYQAKKDEFQNRIVELANEIARKTERNQFMALDNAAEVLTEAARKGTVAGIQRVLNGYKDYYNIREDTAKKLYKLMSDISRMPAEYFEAKPERAVGLDEIRAVVHPDNISAQTAKWLDDKGVKHYAYEAGNEAARLDALNNEDIQGLRFSERDSDNTLLSPEQIEYFKDSKVRDDKGKLLKMYHGTSNSGFTEFAWEKQEYGLFGPGFYFTDNDDVAWSYTQKGKGENRDVYEVYLDIKNPMDMDAIANPDVWGKALRANSVRFKFTDKTTNEQVFRAWQDDLEDQRLPRWEAQEETLSLFDGMGYDGLTHIGGGRRIDDSMEHRVYIAFNAEQIKNADNLTPTSSPDIRYSERDSDNTLLSPEQIEYFKDSKVRDEQGRLLKVYHGTNSSFTVFNTKYGSYFTDAKRVADGFARGKGAGEYYLDIQRPYVVNADKGRWDGIEAPREMGKTNAKYVISQDDVADYREFRSLQTQLQKMVDDGAKVNDIVKWHDEHPRHSELMPIATRIIQEEAAYNEKNSSVVSVEDVIEWAQDQGKYDGLIISNVREGYAIDTVANDYIAFSPEQIKSTANLTPTSSPDIRYSERQRDYLSQRDVLAGAFDQIAKTDTEKAMLNDYKRMASKLNRLEAQAAQMRKQNTEDRKNKGDKAQIAARAKEIADIENRIDEADRRLLRMQNAAPLRNALRRESDRVYRETAEKYRIKAKEARQDAQYKKDKQTVTNRVDRAANRLKKWILNPDKKHSVPEEWRKTVASLLLSLDMATMDEFFEARDSYRSRSWQEAMGALATKMSNADIVAATSSGDSSFAVHFDPNLAITINDLIERNDGSIRYRDLSGQSQLEIANILESLANAVETANAMRLAGKYVESKLNAGGFIEYSKTLRDKKLHGEAVERMLAAINFDMADSFRFFEALGESAKPILNELYNVGFSKLVRNTEQAQEFFKKLDEKYAKYGMANWSGKNAQTRDFKIGSGMITMTPGQVMELYMLNKREQARGHIYGQGIRVERIQLRKKGKAAVLWQKDALTISPEEVAAITATLSDAQIRAAEDMGVFLTETSATWGNEASMQLYGYNKFTEPNYFPIHSDPNFLLTPDPNSNEMMNALLNIGATKETKKNAKNPIIISDIMDTMTRHVTDMANYNAFASPLLTAMKWFNYQQVITSEDGTFARLESVKSAMERAHGKEAISYFVNLLKDINGIKNPRVAAGFSGIVNSFIGKFKISAVAANARVIIQQHSSYVRAASMINPDILALAYTRSPKRGMQMARKYSAIAAWKHMGYWDTNIGPQMTDLISGNKTLGDKVKEAAIKPAGFADDFTLGVLWNAAEIEVGRNYKGAKNSEDFYQKVGERLTEVIDKTQVVDTVFHRSQIMRDKDGLMKMATNFMAEPIKNFNLISAAIKTKDFKTIARVGVSMTASMVINAMLAGLIDAPRDKEKDKGWQGLWESWLKQTFGIGGTFFESNVWDNANPIGMIPFGKDVYGLATGFSPSRPDLQAAQRMIWAGQDWIKLFNGEYDKGAYELIYKTASAISTTTGIPISNVMRDVMALITTVDPRMVIGSNGIPEKAIYERYATALLEGDEDKALDYYDALIQSGKTEKDVASDLKSKLGSLYKEGEITEEQVAGIVKDEKPGDVYKDLRKWDYAKENGSVEGYKVMATFVEAVRTGKNLRAVISDYMDPKKYGYDKSAMASAITSAFKDEYVAASNYERARLKGYLLNAYVMLGYDRQKKSKDIDDWLTQKK